jgi:sulfite reductase beta subunit-like hemoprotein
VDTGQSKTSPSPSEIPSYPGVERILGVYPQRQPASSEASPTGGQGLFMQRIRVLGGRISWLQWRKVAELVRRYTTRTPIHITTRQDIEMHDVAGADIKTIQQELLDVGLSTRGACGDTIRNITVCPGCRFDPVAGGVFALARFVNDCLSAQSFNLPRKFKISFSGCLFACAKPWLSDLGFIAQQDGSFTVIGAGSLGPKPALGISLYTDLDAKYILPLCLAALRFFEQAGDRENRSRARFRHVREKLGDEQFKAQLSERFDRIRSAENWPDVPLIAPNRNAKLVWRLQLPNGNIKPDEAIQLADAAEPYGAELRINLEHGIELYGPQTIQLPDNLAALENLPSITACPGLSSCARAITDTWAVADAIRQRIAHIKRPDLRICISGCPNGCAHSAVADIGLIGMRRNRDGQSAECYRILTSGHNAVDNQPAVADEVVFAEDVPAAIELSLLSPE